MEQWERVNESVLGMRRSGIRRFTEEASQIPDCLFLTLGEPDFDTPAAIKEAAKRGLDQNLTHYPPNGGILELRQRICRFEEERNGLSYQPDEVIVTNGAAQGLAAVFYSILRPGDEVIIPTPAFSLYESLTTLAGGTPVFVETADTSFEIEEARLREAVTERTKALVLTSPNNPTGHVYGKGTLELIRRVAAEGSFFVICDDVYRQLVYTKDYHSFAEFQELRDRIIVAQSFSKPYAMTGWRVGYLLGEKRVMEQLLKTHQYMVSGVSHFSQAACVAALDCDVSEMREVYRRRRDFVYQRLAAMGLELVKPEGAFYLFPSIEKYESDSLEFCRRLARERQVALVPGVYFGAEGYVRLSYCVDDRTLTLALDRLESFLAEC